MKHITLIATAAFLFAACGGEKTENTNNNVTEQLPPNTATAEPQPTEIPAEINTLLEKNTCLTCHKVDEKLVGPAYKDVAQKGYSDEEMVSLMYAPKPENWPGYPPMLAQTSLPKDEALTIAKWINGLK
jgi:cytochrome c